MQFSWMEFSWYIVCYNCWHFWPFFFFGAFRKRRLVREKCMGLLRKVRISNKFCKFSTICRNEWRPLETIWDEKFIICFGIFKMSFLFSLILVTSFFIFVPEGTATFFNNLLQILIFRRVCLLNIFCTTVETVLHFLNGIFWRLLFTSTDKLFAKHH